MPTAVPPISPPDVSPREGPQLVGSRTRWPLERILFLMAGTMTGLSAILAAVLSPWFLLLTGFVAINQLVFVTLGNCPSSWVLRHRLGVRSAAELVADRIGGSGVGGR